MGPHEVSANTRELLGRAKAEARLLEAHGWTPVHVIVGANRSLARQLQQLTQAFGDPHAKASLRHQGNELRRRAGTQQAAAGASRGSKSQEGWVQWQKPKKNSEKQEMGDTRSMSAAGSSRLEIPSRSDSSVGQRHQGSPGNSSPIQTRNHLPYAGHAHSVMASLSAAAHL